MSKETEDLSNADTNHAGLSLKGELEAVKRLNKVPIIIVGSMVLVFMFGLIYTVNQRAENQREVASVQEFQVVNSWQGLQDILDNAPDGVIPDALAGSAKHPKTKVEPRKQAQPEAAQKIAQPAAAQKRRKREPPARIRKSQLSPELKRESIRIQRLQTDKYMAALREDSEIKGFAASIANHGGSASSSRVSNNFGRSSNPIAELPVATTASEDQNKQAHKEKFLNSNTSGNGPYLAHVRRPPLSPFEIKAGTVIPALMITGINSDLPGQLSAQVSQNVYNTDSGDHLMIPQGSKLVGRYDSRVAFYQKRVLVVWNRLIFPDASSIELSGMSGSDQEGYAGFEDQVDNHYFQVFGSAILMSFVSAGAQLSQPDNTNINDDESSSAALSAALGQQIGEVSAEMTRKNLKIQPTIEIRPGYRFNVMVNKDIAFKQPYK
ncbi:TrbI/VirB10 family protein [Solemya pervernicosa gill symbiont]|nr:TrbI/VirB10 family protein [Solemya pervernicosa gill symbiont]